MISSNECVESVTARVRFNDPNGETINEEDDYLTARYMCATDAINRIFRFQICQMLPAVITLPVHLKGGNTASYNNRASNGSLLIRWLKMRPLEQENLSYREYYEQFVVAGDVPTRDRFEEVAHGNIPVRFMSRRVRGSKIAHLSCVMPSRGEVYYLRVLLDEGVVARTWTGLRTVNGQVYDTYQAAAVAMGLFDDVVEAQRTLREAIELYRTPAQLRFMFTQLILDGIAPAVPLLDEFFDNLSADFRHIYPQDPIRVRRLLMQHLDEMLRQHNRSLIDFGFEAIELRGVRLQDEDDFWRPRIDIIRHEVQQRTQQLNGQQREFFDECSLRIAESHEDNVSLICFLQGKGK